MRLALQCCGSNSLDYNAKAVPAATGAAMAGSLACLIAWSAVVAALALL